MVSGEAGGGIYFLYTLAKVGLIGYLAYNGLWLEVAGIVGGLFMLAIACMAYGFKVFCDAFQDGEGAAFDREDGDE